MNLDSSYDQTSAVDHVKQSREPLEIKDSELEILDLKDDVEISQKINPALEFPIEGNSLTREFPIRFFKFENTNDLIKDDKTTTLSTASRKGKLDTFKTENEIREFQFLKKAKEDEANAWSVNCHSHSFKSIKSVERLEEKEILVSEIVIEDEAEEYKSIFHSKPSEDDGIPSCSSVHDNEGFEEEENTYISTSSSISPSYDVITSSDVTVSPPSPQNEELCKSAQPNKNDEIKSLGNGLALKNIDESRNPPLTVFSTSSTPESGDVMSGKSSDSTANNLRPHTSSSAMPVFKDQPILVPTNFPMQHLTMSQQNNPSIVTRQIYFPNPAIAEDHYNASNSGSYFTVSFILKVKE